MISLPEIEKMLEWCKEESDCPIPKSRKENPAEMVR